MDARDVILIIVGILSLVLGGVILRQNSSASRWYAAAVTFAAFWAFFIFAFRTTSSLELAKVWMKLSYVSALLIGEMLFIFSFAFPERPSLPFWFRLPIHLVTATVIAFLLGSSFLVSDVILLPNGKEVLLFAQGKVVFGSFFIFFFLGALGVLFFNYRRSGNPIHRMQYLYVLYGVGLSGIFGVLFNFILPFLQNHEYIWLGPMFLFVMVASIAYAILKHNLFETKVISAQLFSFFLLAFLFSRIFSSATTDEYVINGFVFLGSVIFSILLIRGVLNEVKSRQKIEELAHQLSAANEELKRLDAAKSEFISIAGHQLRTPLTVIKGYASMVMEGSFGEIGEKAREAISKVFISSVALTKLIADLLDLSRIEAGKIRYDMKEMKLDDVVYGVLGELQETAAAKSVTLKFSNQNLKNRVIFADIDKMHELVINLIDNAIKYSEKGKVDVGLAETERDRKRYLLLSVKDTGMGIKAEDMPKLFIKFVRSEEARKVRPDGMGIGLYFAKKIVEDHHGRVWAESPGLGKGSTFFVELPVH